ncbi:MAG TPA: tRNA (adenosine(37)-N6)-threonylcarbamoyltransferase complex ATPase subunit type 1 TsaE [Flavobacterium sp.]|jgi:tRNA threonylcarbamoyladenosine biosynthesis protein TsaE|nr:tRNA (adenosine(37)-N6)-threonylcarbamoyltransferase complex ATPase subunit type 1 TsaE [Flavobacterium sp.]HQV35162.1 tRNA (adenosine(37)-N6)-threonylcarbamoyltransferase complex ATPase subunit type 1 TsaE [Flavobacterium sp.]HRZ73912.1 tRNA (adenosine(37)-N6)-threonylcarbamoyltransferase complex ATPase subunit type 1 TsaE [Flavobacterium sp.]
MEFIYNLNEIDAIAQQVIAQNPQKVILFNGLMGVGKTTFIKALSKRLGVEKPTSSPTFSLVNEYQAKEGLVYHFDVYRLKNEMEALDFGIEDYLYSGNWCFIEWAEKIPNLIPEKHNVITIEILDNGNRKLILD